MNTITNIGNAAILQAVASGYVAKIDITRFELGASASVAFDPTATTLPGGTVYVGNASEISAYVVGSNTIMYAITLPETVGGFTYGNVGLYLATGELFAYDVLPQTRVKNVKNLPVEPGDIHRHYLPLTFSKAEQVVNISVSPSIPADLPSVNLVTDLPSAVSPPHSLYIVRNIASLGGAGLAYSDGATWRFTSLSNQTLSSYAQGSSSMSPVVTGSDSVALGTGSVTGNNSFSFGPGSVLGNRSFNLSGSSPVKGDYSIVSGDGNTVGASAVSHHNVVIGSSNTTLTNQNFIVGSNNESLADGAHMLGTGGKAQMPYEFVRASGIFDRRGDAQESTVILFGETTTVTPEEILIAGSEPVFVEVNSAVYVNGVIFCVDTVLNATRSWTVEGKIERFSTISHSLDVTPVEAAPTTAGINFTDDSSNDALRVFVTSASANPTRWIARLNLLRIMW